jgi:hypothetical protein
LNTFVLCCDDTLGWPPNYAQISNAETILAATVLIEVTESLSKPTWRCLESIRAGLNHGNLLASWRKLNGPGEPFVEYNLLKRSAITEDFFPLLENGYLSQKIQDSL